MKQILAVMFVAALAFLATGCEKQEAIQAREETQRVQRLQRLQTDVNEIVGGIQYIKDARTGLCFAYYWGGAVNGGPALATVPCEAIPPNLLMVAK